MNLVFFEELCVALLLNGTPDHQMCNLLKGHIMGSSRGAFFFLEERMMG